MFWLLALVLLASLAGIGYRQGAIRVAFSFLGILFGALLAGLLAKPIKPLLVALGLKTPALAWLLAPVVVFVIISIIFKVAGYMVHQKVDVHFKYHAGDLRLALWERLSRRLGLCLGLANGALYLILISAVIYPLSYWTFQLSPPLRTPEPSGSSTGWARTSRAPALPGWPGRSIPMPQIWYDAADLAGLLYKNPLSEARLARYPAFLGLAERQEFQDLASDQQFTELALGAEADPDAARPSQGAGHPPEPRAAQGDLDHRGSRHPGPACLPGDRQIPQVRPGEDPWPLELQRDGRHGPVPQGQAQHLLQGNADWSSWFTAAFAKTSFVAMTDHQAILKTCRH